MAHPQKAINIETGRIIFTGIFGWYFKFEFRAEIANRANFVPFIIFVPIWVDCFSFIYGQFGV